jgi:hypothetical protein
MGWACGKLARYERVRDRLLDGRTEEEHLRDADRVLAVLKQRAPLG